MTASKYIPYFDNEFTKGNPGKKRHDYLVLIGSSLNDIIGG